MTRFWYNFTFERFAAADLVIHEAFAPPVGVEVHRHDRVADKNVTPGTVNVPFVELHAAAKLPTPSATFSDILSHIVTRRRSHCRNTSVRIHCS